MDFEDFQLDVEPFNITFDGISDISNVASRFFTFIGNVIRGRLVSIIKYVGP